MAIEFEKDERTEQERFASSMDAFYDFYIAMMDYWGEYAANNLDMPTHHRILSIGSELKDLTHDLKQVK